MSDPYICVGNTSGCNYITGYALHIGDVEFCALRFNTSGHLISLFIINVILVAKLDSPLAHGMILN